MKPHVAILLLLMLTGLLVAAACFSEPRQPFSVAWSYDTSGYLETCGCSSHQLGGLGRRATEIEQLRSKGSLLAIEGAHIVEDKGEFQLFKGQMIVEALNRMQYSAMQLGVREAQQGPEALGKLAEVAKFPLFSANLQLEGAPWLKQYVTTKIAGTDVAITGASQPELADFELPQGASFSDPAQALDSVLAKMKGADMRIICLEGRPEWIEQMAQRYASDADLFLSGNRQEGADLEFHTAPPRLNSFDRGRYLGLVTVDRGQGYVFSGQNIPLTDEFVDAATIKDLLDNTYKPQLKDKFFGQIKGSLTQLFMPAEYCAECHKKEYDVYLASHHSKALETLQTKGQLYNPDCMKCHLTFDPGEDKLMSMNCVTCHTNITDDHVFQATDDPKKIVAPNPPVTTYTYEWCVQCHDPLNSSNFKEHWPQYVNKVYHGGDESAASEAAKALGIDIHAPPPPHE